MGAKIAYMFGEVPTLWVAAPVYFIAAVLIPRYLWTRKDVWSCNLKKGLFRSALLALIVTPSIVSDFYVCVIVAPATMGFVAMLLEVPIVRHDILFACVVFSLLYYVLPWALVSLTIFGFWLGVRSWRRQRT